MNNQRSTFSLIGDRYLDTQFDDEHIKVLEKELENRGVIGFRRLLMEYLAASGLWWNILWWEWINLDAGDVRIGWIQNIFVFSIPATILGSVFGYIVFIGCLVVLHLLTLSIGLQLRSGTRINNHFN